MFGKLFGGGGMPNPQDEQTTLQSIIDERDRHRGSSMRRRAHDDAMRAWDHVNSYMEENDELRSELTALKARLDKSIALNRLTLTQNEGLLETVRHLRHFWIPQDIKEMDLKENSINPLLHEKIRRAESDPEVQDRIKQKIEAKLA